MKRKPGESAARSSAGWDGATGDAPSAERVGEASLPTRYGTFKVVGYRGVSDGGEHAALVYGRPNGARAVHVRMHSECLTGDIFGSLRCDCGSQLDAAMRAIVEAGSGIVVYLRQEGRGIGLLNKIRAYALQEQGLDTVEANEELGLAPDARDYRVGAAMLRDLGVTRIRLMSNNPQKIQGLEHWGIDVVERVPLVLQPMHENFRYMETKALKMGHLYRVHDLGMITAIKAEVVA